MILCYTNPLTLGQGPRCVPHGWQSAPDVDEDVGDPIYGSLHQALEAGWATQKVHGAGNPLEKDNAKHCESSVGLGPGMQDHLPEFGSEVYGTENGTTGMANLADALADILHQVLVLVRLVVKGSKVMH